MIGKLCAVLGSFLLLFAFLLELFVLIGQLSNRTFLRSLYLNSFQSQTGNQVYNYALWNYCTGTSESIQSCAHPVAAFNWADTPGVGQAIPQQFRTSSIVKSLFLALFILYFIGTIFSFLFWLISMPIIACVRGKRHAPGGIMSSLVLLNLLIMIASLVLALVISISANKAVAGSGWTGRCGNSMWITIGAVVSLFFAWLCYNGACCCPGGGALRRRRRRDRVADEAHAEKGLYHDEKTAAPETDNAAGAAPGTAGAADATTAATSPNPGATSPGVGYSSSPHPAGGAQNAAPHTPQLLQGYLPKNTPAQGGQYTAAGSPSPTPMNRPQVEPFKYELPHGTIHSQYSPALTHNYQ